MGNWSLDVFRISCFLYFILGQENQEVVLIWVGFQILWLVLRILVYHFGEPEDSLFGRILVGRPFVSLPSDMKQRVLNLTLALSKYQTHVHPRGEYSYKEDWFSSKELLVLRTAPTSDFYPFQSNYTPTTPVKLKVIGVIGDTTLSSALWMMGKSKLTPMDVYDACILILSILSSLDHDYPDYIPVIRATRALSFTCWVFNRNRKKLLSSLHSQRVI